MNYYTVSRFEIFTMILIRYKSSRTRHDHVQEDWNFKLQFISQCSAQSQNTIFNQTSHKKWRNSKTLHSHTFSKSLPCFKIHLYTFQSHLNSPCLHTVQPININAWHLLTLLLPPALNLEHKIHYKNNFSAHATHSVYKNKYMTNT
jgi:hypothetical protein